MNVALAQIAPVYLDREATIQKMVRYVNDAAEQEARLVCFGETLVPGYPIWPDRTDGARFESPEQKQLFAHYLDQGVSLEAGHLEPLRAAAREHSIHVVCGIVERPQDRGSHSLYCSAVTIDSTGAIANVHRKLVPTYEERLVWSNGDGAGLRATELGDFRLGTLNCWENWMPLARAALYSLGVDLHVALWPGGEHNTRDLTRFIARESRSYVLSVSGLLRARDIPDSVPMRDAIVGQDELFLNGGSAVAGPDGEWLLEPVVGEEALLCVRLDAARVREERQNFDPSGHYARPDVLSLTVDRRRQSVVEWRDG